MCQEISDVCRNTLFLEEIIFNQLGRSSIAGDDTMARGTLSIFAFDLQPSCPAGLKAEEVLGIGMCKASQGRDGLETVRARLAGNGLGIVRT